MRAIVALNKIDKNENYRKIAEKLAEDYKMQVVPISATQKTNTEELQSGHI